MGYDLTFEEFRLAASTADLDEEPAAREHADLVEFRMDLADDPIAQLAEYDGDLPLLVTNRPTWEGGEVDADETSRLDALASATAEPAVVAADVELEALRDAEGKEAAARIRENDAAVVASAHDFETTPDEAALLELLDEATALGDIGKLAVTAADRDDTFSLLAATHVATVRGLDVATMAMGSAGSHTRAVAPLYGSKIGYAPVDPAKATAPGQYDLATLSSLLATLSDADT